MPDQRSGRGRAVLVPAVWWRRRSLRARLALTTAAGLAIALVAVAWLVAYALQRSLIGTLDNSARQSARDVVTLIDANRLPDPILTAGGTTVQVVDARGRITAASPGTDRLVPLVNGRLDHARFLDGRAYGLPGPLRVVTEPARDGRTVIAAVPYEQVRQNIGTLRRGLFVGTPVLLVLLAAASRLVIGGALRPITELRRGAEEISGTARSRRLPVPQARDEVHDLAVTLNDMLGRLEAAEARQRALVSDTAHELRSPLSSMRAQLEVALDHPHLQHWPETASGVLAETLRLSQLADDLLTLARLAEHGPTQTKPIDLAALARARVPSRAEPADPAQGGPVVEAVTPAEPAMVRGDPAGLARMLGNLVDNAVRHATSAVRVAVRRDGDRIELTVTDDGPGIAAADRERVFARFTRLDEGRSRDEGGAGLGLAIVRETARAHGGDAHLEDAHPGLRAVIRLPAIP